MASTGVVSCTDTTRCGRQPTLTLGAAADLPAAGERLAPEAVSTDCPGTGGGITGGAVYPPPPTGDVTMGAGATGNGITGCG
jgi:hypothetical protein